ncbi:16S rRNA (uracil(1498)-N(3))-methyltransferase [Lachnospiraceae bacterium ZAX-1]
MFQFFVEDHQIGETQIWIAGEDVNHMRHVLRMKPGTQLRISNRQGQDYFCELEYFSGNSREGETAFARILYKDRESTELPAKIVLFQGLPKGDKMEWVIQKAVELGAYEIVPVAMRNCVVKLAGAKADAKIKRWQAIAQSAAKQAKRSIIPNVHAVMDFADAVGYAQTMDIRLVPYENETGMTYTKEVMKNIGDAALIGVFIGPEGGFDKQEIKLVQETAHLLSLGKRILRTETAGLTMLSILLYHLED